MNYRLVGHLWWIGPGRIDYNDNIDQEIKATDLKDAIKKTGEIIRKALKKDGCPRDCSVSCKIYKPSHEIGTFDRWDIMEKKGYKSRNRLGVQSIRKSKAD